MPAPIDLQKAVRSSIQTEKNAMDFYKAGAERLRNAAAKKVFELLAKEEREHAGWFYSIYRGEEIPSLDAFLDAPPEKGAPWIAELEELGVAEFDERKAMELAMDKEKELERALREMAAKIDDPQVKKVYEENAQGTHNHFILIESEYARLMGMVHETDIDTFVRE
ncbi:MAG: ferritin [Desulfuromonas sp.]|uniref:ferritin-like domain-containing protein n=1 Tax=Desulfuromonas sp. TaxID=892 RepID=UPI000CC9DB3B|nr:ferritin family protein [Desulfuromonas sp.]PLX82672.1 MAG: ferritin [Desulfuromonas sp.]